MYTSAGNCSLRNSFPAIDSGVAKKLRENGVVILGKLGLSEYANFFGNQPSGFSNLTGQVLNARRRRPEPERLVVGLRRGGRRGAVDADDRHRDLRLDHLPVAGQRPRRPAPDGRPRARLRHRADLGLAGHRRPDGPHGRQRGDDAAVDRRPRRRTTPTTTRGSGARASSTRTSSRRVPATVPNYMSALDLNFVRGKRIGYNGTLTDGTPLKHANAALVAAGAILVERPTIAPAGMPGRLGPQLRGAPRHRPATTRTSARTRRSRPSPRRSPTTRPTRRRR